MNKDNVQQSINPENYSEITDNLASGKGDFLFKGDLKISGIFSGKLTVSGTLTLDAKSHLTGEVVVNDLIVFGQMVGTARVTSMVVFHTSSVFSGTVTASEAEIYSGSCISGKRTIGRIFEKESPRMYRSSKFNLEDQLTIPDEMTHPFFRL